MPGIFLGLELQASVFFWVCNMKLRRTPPPPPPPPPPRHVYFEYPPGWAILSAFLLNYFRLKAGKRRKGDVLQVGGHQQRLPPHQTRINAKLLKISPIWQQLLIGEMLLLISLPNLSVIPPTCSEKIHAEIMHTGFSMWSVPNSATGRIQSIQASSNSPISTWHPAAAHCGSKPQPCPAQEFQHFHSFKQKLLSANQLIQQCCDPSLSNICVCRLVWPQVAQRQVFLQDTGHVHR